MELREIEQLTKCYADAREILSERVRQLQEKLEFTKAQRLPGIKNALGAAAEAETSLRAAIGESNGAFERPRMHVFYGIKVGFQKGRGGIEWDDPDHVCRLVEKYFPDQVDTLLVVKVTPSKPALKNLPAGDLARLGVRVIETGDEIVVKPVDGEIDKLVTALLKDATNEE